MSDLTTKQRRTIIALLEQPTTEAAAKSAGVTSRTIRRWFDDPAFVDALRQAESEAVSAAARQLAGGASEAAAALRSVLTDPNATAAAKSGAARAILASLPPIRLLSVIENRLDLLELLKNDNDTFKS